MPISSTTHYTNETLKLNLSLNQIGKLKTILQGFFVCGWVLQMSNLLATQHAAENGQVSKLTNKRY